ncbi:MAG: hypothetical protein RBT25_03740 [Lentisphaeria bacterium]|nr:hypothetical protein [Lentisphaeria bacterium]
MMRNFLLCLLLLALSLPASASIEQLFQAGILPSTQQYFYCDNAALLANPLVASMLADEKKTEAESLRQLPPFLVALSSMLEKGAAENFPAVKRSQLSIDWAGPLADPTMAQKNLKYLLVLELERPLPAEELGAFLGRESEANKLGLECVFDTELDYLRISDSKNTNNPELGIAFFEDSKLLMLAQPSLLQNVIARVQGRLPAAALPEKLLQAKAKISADKQFYMLLLPDDNFLAAIHEHAPDVPAAQVMEEMGLMCFSLQAEEKLNLQLSMEFSNENNAAVGKSMILDGFIMGMTRMYLMQQLGAQLPMLQTMESSLQGKQAMFSCALEPEDLKQIGPLFQQIGKNMAERLGR